MWRTASTSSSLTRPRASDREPPRLLLATHRDAGMDPSGWRMSEKLDGVRALWDGRRFIFRQGALATALEHVPCEGAPHLQKQRRKIEQAGGEGLMLREPGSAYEAGRSPTLLKVKSFLDAEATVLEHQPGKGRFRGLMGALVVQLADGTRFSVGTGFSENERANPPPIGSVITFRYQELSRSGVPRFPSFVRIASDT